MNVLTPAVQAAADRLEHRAQVARQILEDLGYADLVIAKHKFNDSDWYVFDAESLELISQLSGKNYRFKEDIKLAAGQRVERGMSAKYLGLWRLA